MQQATKSLTTFDLARHAANALVGTDDFTYNDLLKRNSGTGRYGVNNAWTYDDRGRSLLNQQPTVDRLIKLATVTILEEKMIQNDKIP